jgi:uncharacterized membrane protein YqaE (UPF0057 family)
MNDMVSLSITYFISSKNNLKRPIKPQYLLLLINNRTLIFFEKVKLASRLSLPRPQGSVMRLLISLFLPWLTFFTIGRPFAGFFCLLLQMTILGWIPATIWAVYALSQYKTDQKIKQAGLHRV